MKALQFISKLVNDNFWSLVILVAILAGVSSASKHDDTDAPNEHSGMVARIDALTGCEYLATAFGGLTPRMNKDGTQVCRKAP